MSFISSVPERNALAIMIVCAARYMRNINNQTINNMYYEIKYQEKSHGDTPNPIITSVFKANNAVEYKRELKDFTRGCEDWRVREISKEEYRAHFSEQTETPKHKRQWQ